MGYFDKIRRADIFVFLDDVAYPKSGNGMGSWTNRVKVSVQGRAHWIGCPLQRQNGLQLIRNVKIASQPWRQKILRTLDANYRREKNYSGGISILEPLLNYETESLSALNINAIREITRALNIPEPKFVLQSELSVSGSSTELLINIVKAVGADGYLCGGGAGGYQEDDLFTEENISLVYQNFQPHSYGRTEDFLPGLSVIDFLLKCPLS